MKKYLSIILALMLVVALLGMVACEIVPGDTHQHTYATEWSTSETEHWHVATCEHTTEVSDRAPHSFVVEVTRVATATESGLAVYTCTVCKYSKYTELPYGNHEHIVGWERNRNVHTQKYICCDVEMPEPQHGNHTYNDQMVCSVCGKYSVVEDIRDKLNKGMFSYTLALDNINVPLSEIAENKDKDIAINSGAFRVGLDENCMLTLVGTFAGTVSEEIPVGAGKNDIDVVTSNIGGTIIIDQNKVYLMYSADDGAIEWEKPADDSEDGFSLIACQQTEVYNVFDLNKRFVDIGIDDFNGMWDMVLELAYDYSNEIKAVIDAILTIDNGDSFDKWFVKGEGGVYTLDFGVINDFNNSAKDKTIDALLTEIMGEDYMTVIESLVKSVLNITVGDMLDMLKEQGVDIHEINDKLNDLIATYYPGEETTIEQIVVKALAEQGITVYLPSNRTFADIIDSDLVRMYTVLDIINIIGKQMENGSATNTDKGEGNSAKYKDKTEKDIVDMVTDFVEASKDLKVYDIVATLVSKVIGGASESVELTSGDLAMVIDEIGKFLDDCVHVSVTLNKGKLVSAAVEISYNEPAKQSTTDNNDGDSKPAQENFYGKMVAEKLLQARKDIGKMTIRFGLNDSAVNVDVDQVIAKVEANIKDVAPADKETFKQLLEGTFNTVDIVDKDGRDYLIVTKGTESSLEEIRNDSGDYVNAEMLVKRGAYLDELFTSARYSDRCGNGYIVSLQMQLELIEVESIKLTWATSGEALTDKEITDLRTKYKMSVLDSYYLPLFGKAEKVYYDDLTISYNDVTKEYGNEYQVSSGPDDSVLHEYELVSEGDYVLNGNYYTKLVYKCKHCNKTLTYYVIDYKLRQPETDEAA